MKSSRWVWALILVVGIAMVGSSLAFAASPLRHGPQRGITQGTPTPKTLQKQRQSDGAPARSDGLRRSGNYIEPRRLFRPVFIWQGTGHWPMHRVGAG